MQGECKVNDRNIRVLTNAQPEQYQPWNIPSLLYMLFTPNFVASAASLTCTAPFRPNYILNNAFVHSIYFIVGRTFLPALCFLRCLCAPPRRLGFHGNVSFVKDNFVSRYMYGFSSHTACKGARLCSVPCLTPCEGALWYST
jgi:hypothetical protein